MFLVYLYNSSLICLRHSVGASYFNRTVGNKVVKEGFYKDEGESVI